MRYLTGFAIMLALVAGCSRDPQRPIAEPPTAPTALGAGRLGSSLIYGDIGGVSGPMDHIGFPARNELFTFTTSLDGQYQRMGRGASSFYIDREGLAVWTQEYIRYRVNGCDHGTALQRVLTQIAGGAAGGTCAEPPPGVVQFPSRADSYAFIREIDARYQQMGRSVTQLFVDLEGAVIWIQEYLRFRTNACDAATSEQKVFSQIAGGPVPDTCFVACNYTLNPGGINAGAGALSSTFEIRPTAPPTDPRSCGWVASSDASWLTIPNDHRSGNGFTVIPYTVANNNGGDRVGRISFAWAGGGTSFIVSQAGSPFFGALILRDAARSTEPLGDCHIRTASTPCQLIASTNLPGSNYQYAWSVQYTYGNDKSFTANNTSNVLTITEGCGGSGSSAEGAPTNLAVTVTITDDRGNSITLRENFTLRLFTCP